MFKLSELFRVPYSNLVNQRGQAREAIIHGTQGLVMGHAYFDDVPRCGDRSCPRQPDICTSHISFKDLFAHAKRIQKTSYIWYALV